MSSALQANAQRPHQCSSNGESAHKMPGLDKKKFLFFVHQDELNAFARHRGVETERITVTELRVLKPAENAAVSVKTRKIF